MQDKEFIENKCSNCENKYNEKDLCEIRTNTKGQPQCINLKLTKGEIYEK